MLWKLFDILWLPKTNQKQEKNFKCLLKTTVESPVVFKTSKTEEKGPW